MRAKTWRVRQWSFPAPRGFRVLFLCGFFILGCVIGHILAHFFGEDTELQRIVLSITAQEANERSRNLWASITAYLGFPVFAFVLGYCSFARPALPLLMAVQGVSLSFAASFLTASFGAEGIVLALASFGVRGIVTIVSTLLMTLYSFEKVLGCECASASPLRTAGICAFLLTAGIILELTVVPALFSAALTRLQS